MDTINAVAMPIIRIISSLPVKESPNLRIFSRLAPSITGIARKNVNSAATVLDTPISSAPKIVAPDRDVPGKTAAINWNMPIMKAALKVISDKEFTLTFIPLFLFSIRMNPIPKTINAIATQTPL